MGVSLVDYHRLSFHFNSFSLTHLCIFSTPFMSFSYPFHVLVISFFSLEKVFHDFFFEVVRISFPYMCIQFRFFNVIHFFFMSFHELKLDASPNLQTTKFVPFFDVLFEKDKTKANPTPSQLGKGAPYRSPKVMRNQ